MIYIAGKYTAKERLKRERNILRELDPSGVSSSWLDEPEATYYAPEDEVARQIEMADRDWREVSAADCVVVDTIDESTTGGREVEFGMAIALNRTLVVIGPARTIFHHIADYRYPDWASFYEDQYGAKVGKVVHSS